MTTRKLVAWLIASAAFLPVGLTWGQGYPVRAVRLIVRADIAKWRKVIRDSNIVLE